MKKKGSVLTMHLSRSNALSRPFLKASMLGLPETFDVWIFKQFLST